jgi:hypothetical protein
MPLFMRAAVTVPVGEILIVAANPTRRRLWITNPSANVIRIGPPGVTAATGIRLLAGATFFVEAGAGGQMGCPTEQINGIRETADAVGVCAVEQADS